MEEPSSTASSSFEAKKPIDKNAASANAASPKHKKHDNEEKISLRSFFAIAIPVFILSLLSSKLISRAATSVDENKCYRTCRIRIAESIPVNISFPGAELPETTHEAWKRIVTKAQRELLIAAYKSSLQGKHVLEPRDLYFAHEGDEIFRHLAERGRNIDLRMVESFPPKDKGDNADGTILEEMGILKRRTMNMRKSVGREGKMHSKFMLADNAHFYLGSANLDWRSLNQKMELGFVVEDCPCLGSDLRSVFDTYWDLAAGTETLKPAKYNSKKPLKINIGGEEAYAFIAASPKILNSEGRTWDLEALVETIDAAKDFVDLHVMDYHPLFLYRKPRELWPVLDDALRRAIARGVHVKVLSAAIHHPEIGIRFLKALQDLNGISRNGSVEVKIFKVPPSSATTSRVINRDRRTHNKVLVTENAAAIGTSNWSGDYFEGGTTGTALIVRQPGKKKQMIHELVSIFQRNWESEYAHPVSDYLKGCVLSESASFCESKKDPRLFETKKY